MIAQDSTSHRERELGGATEPNRLSEVVAGALVFPRERFDRDHCHIYFIRSGRFCLGGSRVMVKRAVSTVIALLILTTIGAVVAATLDIPAQFGTNAQPGDPVGWEVVINGSGRQLLSHQ